MNAVRDELSARWRRRFENRGDNVLAEVLTAYAEPHRAYHNLDHLIAVLTTVDRLAAEADDIELVELAGWFHDVVYDPRAKDNEERSAAQATARLGQLGLPAARLERVAELILVTRRHNPGEGDSAAAVLCDADLAILAAEADAYEVYARRIRAEYAWVADEDFRAGRADVLRAFLKRDVIYHTRTMKGNEPKARANLQRELDRLIQ